MPGYFLDDAFGVPRACKAELGNAESGTIYVVISGSFHVWSGSPPRLFPSI